MKRTPLDIPPTYPVSIRQNLPVNRQKLPANILQQIKNRVFIRINTLTWFWHIICSGIRQDVYLLNLIFFDKESLLWYQG